jgi:hypothetical protein
MANMFVKVRPELGEAFIEAMNQVDLFLSN